MRTIINPDDEVLIIEPSFVSYAPLVTLAGGVPVPVATTLENEFKVQPQQIEAAITAKTKAILLCSPNNPTGAMLNKSELEEIAVIVEKYNLIVLSDEIYAELVYDEVYTSFASIKNMRDHTILISGFSKRICDDRMAPWYDCSSCSFFRINAQNSPIFHDVCTDDVSVRST